MLAGAITEDGEAGCRQDEGADHNLERTVRLQLGLEVEVATSAQLQGFERLPEVGPGLLYFPFRFSTCLAHSASSLSVVMVFGGAPIFNMLLPNRPRMINSTRKMAVSIPAASACAGISSAIVTRSITTNSKPQNAAAPRKMAALMLLRSISRISILASWISCWTRRIVSS